MKEVIVENVRNSSHSTKVAVRLAAVGLAYSLQLTNQCRFTPPPPTKTPTATNMATNNSCANESRGTVAHDSSQTESHSLSINPLIP